MEEDEGDTCRICRSGAEPNSLLYHPCKCAGSIRYCHQDCLVEWLQHSRKKYCELCSQPFIFHKKYRGDMPPDGKLPTRLYLRRLVIQTGVLAKLVLRAMLVAATWLAVLPYTNINIWRFLFMAADVVSYVAVPEIAPAGFGQNAMTTPPSGSGKLASPGLAAARGGLSSLVKVPSFKAIFKAMSYDVFQGQILTCVIVVLFVGVFWLREWILQHVPQQFEAPRQHADADLVRAELRNELIQAAAAEGRPPPAAVAARGQAEAQMQAQARQVALALQLQQLRERIEEQPEDQKEEEEPKTMDELREMRLRRFGGIRNEAKQFRFDFDVKEEEGSSSVQPWNSWNDAKSSDEEAPGMTDGNAVSDFMTSWQEGSAQTEAAHAESFSPSMSDKGKSKAVDSDTQEAANEQEVTSSLPSSGQLDLQLGSFSATEPPTTSEVTKVEDEAAIPDSAQPLAKGASSRSGQDLPGLHDGLSDTSSDPDTPEEEAAQPAQRPIPIEADPPAADDMIQVLQQQQQDAEDPEDAIALAEEMDGLLEAIGMRGPLHGMLQNLVLMMFLCSFVMIVFVLLPYLVGKVLGPGPRLVHVATLPIKGLRYVTDPIFDALIAFGSKTVWPLLSRASPPATEPPKSSANALGSIVAFLKGPAKETIAPAPVTSSGIHVPAWLLRFIPASQALTEFSLAQRLRQDFGIVVTTGMRGPWMTAKAYLHQAMQRLDAHTRGSASADRAFCLGFGHAYWLTILGVQRHLTSKPSTDRPPSQDSTIKVVMDQQILVLKVLVFILIELVIFPLGCGLLLDLCLMPLFPEASVFNWLDKVRYAPVIFAFTRWMGGTIYMFLFAQYVHTIRGILRPGVLCWIRNPNDPGFDPIKDILDKKSSVHLRKIGTSAVMYAGILMAAVGVNVYLLRYALNFTGVLPLRWKPMDPLTEIPLDLLAVHLILPWVMDKIDLEKMFTAGLKEWWKLSSSWLRLSAYMMGGEHPSETSQDSVYCRVPADDKAITTGPFLIPVTADGEATEERGAEAIHNQEEAMKKLMTKPTYCNILMPPRFRLRIKLLLGLWWMAHCVASILALSLPLLVGRKAIAMLTGGQEPHDFYSFALGAAILSFCAWMEGATKRLYRRAKVRSSRPILFIAVSIRRRLFRLAKVAVIGFGLGVIVPVLIGLTIDQYILTPLRNGFYTVPEINLPQVWAMGLVESRLLHTFIRGVVRPRSRRIKSLLDGIDAISLHRPQILSTYRTVVLPIVISTLALLILPALLVILYRDATREEEQFSLRYNYLTVIGVVPFLALKSVVRDMMASWTDLLKDEIFLESTELKNYQPETKEGTIEGDEGTLPDVLFR